MSFNKRKELRQKYDEILTLVIDKLDEFKRIEVFKDSYTDDNLETIISKFCRVLESDDKTFQLFVNRRNKLFGHKKGLYIIPSIDLKPLLTNEDGGYLWECIQLIYAINRTGDETKKDNVQKIVDSIERFNLEGTMPNDDDSSDDENIEVNETSNETGNSVDNIVMDIADTLRNNMVSASKETEKVNPIENMIKTSQMISSKYGSKLKSGEISMNDMFQSLGRMMGEIDKKTSNDDELKKIDIDEMPDPAKMMSELGVDMKGFNPMDLLGKDPEKMLSELGGGDMKGFNPMDMIAKMLNNKKEQDVLTPEQIKEMEEFYSNIKSDDLEVDEKEIALEKLNKTLSSNNKTDLMNMAKNVMSSLNK